MTIANDWEIYGTDYFNKPTSTNNMSLQIMTESKYNVHTNPLLKRLEIAKVNDILDVQYLKFWYKFVNDELPHFFKSMFTYNHGLYYT